MLEKISPTENLKRLHTSLVYHNMNNVLLVLDFPTVPEPNEYPVDDVGYSKCLHITPNVCT